MNVDVFIENPRGSTTKHVHDEKSLTLTGTQPVSRAYPWPYGFVPETWAADDCCVDCFVLTDRELATGETVRCEVIALLEQIEDGEVDHNVLAVPVGERAPNLDTAETTLREFITHVFAHVDGKRMAVGRLLDAEAAAAHIRAHSPA